jgi:integrase
VTTPGSHAGPPKVDGGDDPSYPGGADGVDMGFDFGWAVEPMKRGSVRAPRESPIAAPLLILLADHRVLANHPEGGLLFPGADSTRPVHPTSLRESVAKAWRPAKQLDPLGFHEARHTAASMFIAAGLNAKTISTLLGHASIAITFDRYGHLMPGSEDEARTLIDAYLERDGG